MRKAIWSEPVTDNGQMTDPFTEAADAATGLRIKIEVEVLVIDGGRLLARAVRERECEVDRHGGYLGDGEEAFHVVQPSCLVGMCAVCEVEHDHDAAVSGWVEAVITSRAVRKDGLEFLSSAASVSGRTKVLK